METNSRLHPLLTAAAISVTVFSAVGVAALTGIVPHTFSSQKDLAPLQISQEVAKPVEPTIDQPTPPVATPKPAHKKPVAHAVMLPPPPAAMPPVAQVETPKPMVQPGNLATIQAVREVKDPGQHTGLGPIAGGVAGAVLGDQIGGKGNTRKVVTVLGALGGAFAGREIEKQARATKHWEIDVRRDDGLQETVRSDVAPAFQPSQRVRIVDGSLQPA
jgi:outer membrane lipoprotein SlyB